MMNQTISNQEENNKIYSEVQGIQLLKLARAAIAEKLGIKTDLPKPSEIIKELDEDIFLKTMGNFVTIHINKKLRGCIGSLESTESLKEGVRENAINAAFHDPRFPPLTLKEFNEAALEVSILSKPLILKYSDSNDLLSKLKPEVHGVIIRKGHNRATFLPQVWKQLPDKADFISNLCRKAGLLPDEWKKASLEVMLYTVQYFEE